MDKFLTSDSHILKKRKDLNGNEIIVKESIHKEQRVNPYMHKALKQIFKIDCFRPHQEEIIRTILDGREDVFVVMPTGGGKSLLFQLPACISQGVTIVISPLLSLIQEQVSTLIQLGIPAAYLTSNCTDKMKDAIFDDLGRVYSGKEPYLKLLYTTPESIVKSDRTKAMLKVMYDNEMIARFVIDEAHCVSSWGHDFRKDYYELGVLRDQYENVRIVALTGQYNMHIDKNFLSISLSFSLLQSLTILSIDNSKTVATARKEVADDVCKVLDIRDSHKICCGFDRPNLYFEVRPSPQKEAIRRQKVSLTLIQTPPI